MGQFRSPLQFCESGSIMAFKIFVPAILFLLLGLVSSDGCVTCHLAHVNEAIVETEGLDLPEPEGLDLAEGVEKHEPLSREKRGVQYDADTDSYITTSDPVESSSFKRSSSSSFPTSRSVSNTRASASYHQSLDDISYSGPSSSFSGGSRKSYEIDSSSRSGNTYSSDGCRLVWVHEQRCDDGYEKEKKRKEKKRKEKKRKEKKRKEKS